MGLDPGDGDLYVATHLGLFRLGEDGGLAQVGQLRQDTMGFTVVGPSHFLASGHPDVRDQRLRVPGRPPLLGLIESRDGGRSWASVSLLGEADFHSLLTAHGSVYGYDATGSRFMVAGPGGDWEERSIVALGAFTVDPADGDHVVATTPAGLTQSSDGGRTWAATEGPALSMISWDAAGGFWGVTPEGGAYRYQAGRWEPRASVRGRPEALLATKGLVLVATATATGSAVYVSSDDGRSWRQRYWPPPS